MSEFFQFILLFVPMLIVLYIVLTDEEEKWHKPTKEYVGFA